MAAFHCEISGGSDEDTVPWGRSGGTLLCHLDEAARPGTPGHGAGAQQGQRYLRLGRGAVG